MANAVDYRFGSLTVVCLGPGVGPAAFTVVPPPGERLELAEGEWAAPIATSTSNKNEAITTVATIVGP